MAQSKNTIMLVLLALFFVLAISISVWVSSIYQKTSSYSNRTARNSVECSELALSATILDYNESSVILAIKNEIFGEGGTSGITVKSGTQTKTFDIIIEPGEEKTIEVKDFLAKEKLAIYPKGCEQFKINCNLIDKTCGK